jgi:hypothetical protein
VLLPEVVFWFHVGIPAGQDVVEFEDNPFYLRFGEVPADPENKSTDAGNFGHKIALLFPVIVLENGGAGHKYLKTIERQGKTLQIL